MKFLGKIASLIGMDAQSAPRPELVQLRTALEEGRRHKRSESYEQAVACFNRAAQLAENMNDQAARSIIHIQLADLHIRSGNYPAAEAILDELEAEANRASNGIQLAYVLVSRGTLAQLREDWAGARALYERAVEMARASGASGPEGRAMGHLADTFIHEGNASYAVYLLRDALPKLNGSGDVELSSYFVGRLGEAEIATGHTTEGYEMLARALRLAQHMNYRRYERMWHAVIGREATRDAKYVDAYRHLNDALKMTPANSSDLGPLMRDMATACLNLNHLSEAVDYASQAALLMPDDLETKGVYGLVLRAVGESANAIPLLEEAASAPERIDLRRALAAAYADVDDDEKAMAMYQQALNDARKADNLREMARSHRDLGMYHFRRRKYHQALDTFVDALGLYEKLDIHAQVARLHCDIGNLRLYLGQGQRAMKDFEQALQQLGTIDDPATRGVVLSNAAMIYMDRGDLDTAESFYTESIQLAQKTGDTSAEATRQGNYGWYLLQTGRVKRALGALEYALQHSQRLSLPLHIAVQTSNLALAYAELGENARAETDLRASLERINTIEEPYWRAIIRINLSAHLVKTGGDIAEAAALNQQALEIARSIESAEAISRAQTNQAHILLLQGDIEGAHQLINETVMQGRKMGIRRLLGEALYIASRVQVKRGEQAAATWQEANKIFTLLHHPLANKTPEWLG